MKFKTIIMIILAISTFTSCNSQTDTTRISSQDEEVIDTILEEETNEVGMEEELEVNQDMFDLSQLNSVDLDGNSVDASIFKDKYTLINVWATNCKPCIVEMPDLQKLHENLGGEEFQVIGIVSNTYVESDVNMDDANNIVEQTGVLYTNVIPDEMVIEEVLSHIQFVPTTFIVDSEGKYIGEMVYGLRDCDFFELWIKSIM